MTVDRSEVNAMAGWMAALGNAPETLTETGGRRAPPETNRIAPPPPMVSSESISEMAKFMKLLPSNPDTLTAGHIPAKQYTGEEALYELQNPSEDLLTRFYTSTNNVIAEAPVDRALREALVIEKTETGVSIGNWEIVEYQTGKRKTYDVRHKDTNECIASELMLYDAACGLARALNEGYFINSTNVIELMNSEVTYASAVNDMILYKHHLKKNPNSNKATLYETRYNEAKRKALSAKDKVTLLSDTF